MSSYFIFYTDQSPLQKWGCSGDLIAILLTCPQLTPPPWHSLICKGKQAGGRRCSNYLVNTISAISVALKAGVVRNPALPPLVLIFRIDPFDSWRLLFPHVQFQNSTNNVYIYCTLNLKWCWILICTHSLYNSGGCNGDPIAILLTCPQMTPPPWHSLICKRAGVDVLTTS